jgi:hypothetical protein
MLHDSFEYDEYYFKELQESLTSRRFDFLTATEDEALDFVSDLESKLIDSLNMGQILFDDVCSRK